MIKQLILNLTALLVTIGIASTALAVMVPQAASAAKQTGDKCSERLLTLPTWYRGLTDDKCNIKMPGGDADGLSGFVWHIALNIIEMVLQIIGYLSVAFIIVGGYKYMISAGSSDGMVKARKTITNAIIGLVISIASVGIVNVIAGALK